MQDLQLWELIQQGGFFVYPLLVLSIISAIIILERLCYFSVRQYRLGKVVTQIDTLEECQHHSKNPMLQVLHAFSSDLKKGETHCLNVYQREANRQISHHERGLKSLATIGAISPLIGLLGTVWGMVLAFAQIAAAGDGVSTSDFAGGIWTGLLTTVAGLIVAIPAVAAARLFESKVDKLARDLNELASHLKEYYFTA
ncbi:MotA/TolQ/ExbB proton channel family protein [Rubritalea marina]|uniref:MotA/TolQ/ExbB proton channel family protein n=1 Tax=Rubritalea marina TaxID=361055 RepID=UPI0003679FF7|nr:MotA/TolQ/ExbB proton channel family protein [Rubritalea marina]